MAKSHSRAIIPWMGREWDIQGYGSLGGEQEVSPQSQEWVAVKHGCSEAQIKVGMSRMFFSIPNPWGQHGWKILKILTVSSFCSSWEFNLNAIKPLPPSWIHPGGFGREKFIFLAHHLKSILLNGGAAISREYLSPWSLFYRDVSLSCLELQGLTEHNARSPLQGLWTLPLWFPGAKLNPFLQFLE